MKRINGFLTVFIAVLTLGGMSPVARANAICPKINPEDFQKALADHDAEEVVFFASWCIACKDHIQRAGDKTVFVAVFDDGEKAGKAFAAVGGKGSCYFDASGEIAKQYGVTGLPAKISVNEKSKN